MAAPKDNAQWQRDQSTADGSSNFYQDPGSYTLGSFASPQRILNANNPQSDGTSNLDENSEFARLRLLSQDIGKLLNKTEITDCCLKVDDGTYFYVHKAILVARSSVFEESFTMERQNRVKDGESPNRLHADGKSPIWEFTIQQISSKVMRLAIIFMYTGSCELDDYTAAELLNVAGSLDIKALKVYAAHYLVKVISVENFKKLIESAYKYTNELLKQECIKFFINHAKEIMGKCQEWASFAKDHPTIVSELLYWKVNPELFLQRKK